MGKKTIYISKTAPVSPALRNSATATARGTVSNLPPIGSDWELEVSAFNPVGDPLGYIAALWGEDLTLDPDMAGNMGIVRGYQGGLENRELFNAYGHPNSQTINRKSFGVGRKTASNVYNLKAVPGTGIQLRLNGALVQTEPNNPNNTWGRTLTLGGLGTGQHLAGYYYYVKLWIGGVLIGHWNFADGTGTNVANPGTYDMVLEDGAVVYPDPRPAAPVADYSSQEGETAVTLAPNTVPADYETAFIADGEQPVEAAGYPYAFPQEFASA